MTNPTKGNFLSVVVPVYNEERSITAVLARVKTAVVAYPKSQVIVVNDGSTDQTLRILKESSGLYDLLIDLPINSGKGSAVIAGLKAANGEFVLIQDADLEYDPIDYPVLLEPLKANQADVIIGSRLSAPPITRVHYFWHKVGNRLITLLFNLANNTTFTDVYSGYLVFRRTLIDPDSLKVKGWGQQAEILTFLCRAKPAIYEVPIRYFGRTYEEGKKIRSTSAIPVIITIAVCKFRRRIQ